MANERTTEPTLEEDFKVRSLDYINEKPVEAAPLNILLQRFARKRAAKLSFNLLSIRQEIEHEKNVDAPESLTFWDKLWFVIKKFLQLSIGIAIIVFMAYFMNDVMNDKKNDRRNDAKQEIPANHINDSKGAQQ